MSWFDLMFETNIQKDPVKNRDRDRLRNAIQRLVERQESDLVQHKQAREIREHNLRVADIPVVPVIDCEDNAYTKRIRNLVPEETYEIWHQYPNLYENITTYIHHQDMAKQKAMRNSPTKARNGEEKKVNLIYSESEEDVGDDEEEDEDEEEYDLVERRKKSKKEADKIIATSFNLKVDLMSLGLEVLPHNKTYINAKASLLYRDSRYSSVYSRILTNLMFTSMFRRRWKIAYRCFSLLIRMKRTDLLSLWPIGVEILTKLIEEKFKSKHPNANDSNLKTFFNSDEEMNSEQLPVKDEMFLNWIRNYYVISKLDRNPTKTFTAFPYKTGSKKVSPIYYHCLIWILLLKLKFKEVHELIDECLSKEPFLHDGMFYFLKGYTFQLEATILAKKKNDTFKTKIEALMIEANKLFIEAKLKNCNFPERLLTKEMNLVTSKITEDITFGRENDDNEDGFTTGNEYSTGNEDGNTTGYDDDGDDDDDDNRSIQFDNYSKKEQKYGDMFDFTPKVKNEFNDEHRIRNEDSEPEDNERLDRYDFDDSDMEDI